MVAMMQAPAVQRYEPVGSARELIAARDPEVLAVGPAGTGKTLALCWKLHLAALRHKGARILISRATLESLKPAALNTFINGVMPALSGVTYFGGNRVYPAEFRYPNGSVIHVSGLDRAEKVKSSEYDIIYVNEATEITEATWEMLKSRLRNGAVPYQQIIGDCNPSGPRHWLKRRCEAGKTRMITSTHKDNPAYWDRHGGDWTPIGRMYVEETLAGLSGVERERLYLGKWAAAQGLVYREFNPDIHVQEKGYSELYAWRRALGVDVGSRNPTAILSTHIAGNEAMHVEREFYRRNMTATDIVKAIEDEADRFDAHEIFIDPSAKGIIDDLLRDGYPVTAANNDVIYGIQRCHSVFQAGFSVDPSCINFIDELNMYAYPDNPRVETDKPVKEHDHACDAWRYISATALSIEIGGSAVLSDYLARQ